MLITSHHVVYNTLVQSSQSLMNPVSMVGEDGMELQLSTVRNHVTAPVLSLQPVSLSHFSSVFPK